MAAGYSGIVPVRMTKDDIRRSELMAKKFRTPRSTLIRRVWCEWLDAQMPETNVESPTTI